ncbi:hypothetical protein HZ326_3372 [Fusarium oxysporum f. sp. albedinis]|nr:hypothetical protein HZ326_3372 [Fusarium oxysporum f. sp. albedinis]
MTQHLAEHRSSIPSPSLDQLLHQLLLSLLFLVDSPAVSIGFVISTAAHTTTVVIVHHRIYALINADRRCNYPEQVSPGHPPSTCLGLGLNLDLTLSRSITIHRFHPTRTSVAVRCITDRDLRIASHRNSTCNATQRNATQRNDSSHSLATWVLKLDYHRPSDYNTLPALSGV